MSSESPSSINWRMQEAFPSGSFQGDRGDKLIRMLERFIQKLDETGINKQRVFYAVDELRGFIGTFRSGEPMTWGETARLVGLLLELEELVEPGPSPQVGAASKRDGDEDREGQWSQFRTAEFRRRLTQHFHEAKQNVLRRQEQPPS